MNTKEIQNLIKLINESNLSEFKMKDGDFRLTIRTKEYHKYIKGSPQTQAPVVISTPSSTPTPSAPVVQQESTNTQNNSVNDTQTADQKDSREGLLEIKSPIVGTFYRSPSPDKDPFVKVGDKVNTDSVVCIVEAMKLFNEIEAEVSGKIVDVLVDDGSPVEYDQVLYLVDPKG